MRFYESLFIFVLSFCIAFYTVISWSLHVIAFALRLHRDNGSAYFAHITRRIRQLDTHFGAFHTFIPRVFQCMRAFECVRNTSRTFFFFWIRIRIHFIYIPITFWIIYYIFCWRLANSKTHTSVVLHKSNTRLQLIQFIQIFHRLKDVSFRSFLFRCFALGFFVLLTFIVVDNINKFVVFVSLKTDESHSSVNTSQYVGEFGSIFILYHCYDCV